MLARLCGGRFGVTAPSDPQQANGNGRKPFSGFPRRPRRTFRAVSHAAAETGTR